MSKSLRLAVALMASLSWAAPAAAWKVGAWEISANTQPGKPPSCSMSASYTRGDVVGLLLMQGDSGAIWGITVYNPRWDLKEGAKPFVEAIVDEDLLTQTEGLAIGHNLLFLPLRGVEAFKELQEGATLVLRGRWINERYDLTGTRDAMNAVLTCFNRVKNATASIAPRPSQPAPAPAPARPTGPVAVKGAEAYRLLANILSGSGQTAYKIETPREDGLVAFRYATGSTGVFSAYTNAFGDPDALVTSFIAEHASKCPGKFGSEKKSVPTDNGTLIRQIVLVCGVASEFIETQYNVVQRRDGILMIIGHNLSSDTGRGDRNSAQAAQRLLVDYAVGMR